MVKSDNGLRYATHYHTFLLTMMSYLRIGNFKSTPTRVNIILSFSPQAGIALKRPCNDEGI